MGSCIVGELLPQRFPKGFSPACQPDLGCRVTGGCHGKDPVNEPQKQQGRDLQLVDGGVSSAGSLSPALPVDDLDLLHTGH